MFVLQDNNGKYFVALDNQTADYPYYGKSFKNYDLASKYVEKFNLKMFEIKEYHF